MTIVINNAQDFYNLIKDKSHIIEQSSDLVKFRDFMYLYINGCNCSRDDQFNKCLKIYKKLNKIDNQVIQDLKLSIPCDKIIFNLSGTYIFDI